MERPPESLKDFANRLAKATVSDQGLELARLLRLSGFLDVQNDSAMASKNGEVSGDVPDLLKSETIGVWEKKQDGDRNYFARRLDRVKEWNFWANVGRIESKGKKRRVVFIGESVARGYLYDPEFTPAMVLESMLRSHVGEDQIEVIDLARTNLNYEVRELAITSLQLEPDAIVIFSGNNLGSSFPVGKELAFVDAALHKEGIYGLKQLGEVLVASRIQQIVNDVALVCRDRNIPVLWIIPEFNLGDWRDAVTNAPHLGDGENSKWIKYWENAQAALEKHELHAASEYAEKMIRLDKGVCATSFYILAECKAKLGDTAGARQALELARDSVLWDYSKERCPRVLTVMQHSMRKAAAKFGNETVDVPSLFKEYLGGGIPDRRLFLDYCHMTSEGIRIVMAAAAAGVLRSWKKTSIPWTDFMNKSKGPSNQIEAESSFLAAVHNAHWYQRYELVHHYCREALKWSPHIAELMTRMIELQTRRTPMLMDRVAEEISNLGSPIIHHYLLRHNAHTLDELLLRAIVAALTEIRPNAPQILAELRRKEHSVSHSATDLLDPYYCSSANQPQEILWAVKRRLGGSRRLKTKEADYYKAYWRESRFIFVGEAGCSAQFQLTCRLPESGAAGVISLLVNRKLQAEIQLDRAWSAWDITLSSDALLDGINEVVIRWPSPNFPGQKVLARVADDLIKGIIPEFYGVFGEIHSFTVSAAKAQELPSPEQYELAATGAD